MNKFRKITSKYPFLKFLGNRYVLVIVFAGVWLLFLDNYSYLEHRPLDKKIKELEDNRDYYLNEIKRDSISIQNLKNADKTEHYAREKYYMKRENEDIYIIDYPQDSVEKQKRTPH
jgi:cell division protein DivIC